MPNSYWEPEWKLFRGPNRIMKAGIVAKTYAKLATRKPLEAAPTANNFRRITRAGKGYKEQR